MQSNLVHLSRAYLNRGCCSANLRLEPQTNYVSQHRSFLLFNRVQFCSSTLFIPVDKLLDVRLSKEYSAIFNYLKNLLSIKNLSLIFLPPLFPVHLPGNLILLLVPSRYCPCVLLVLAISFYLTWTLNLRGDSRKFRGCNWNLVETLACVVFYYRCF